MVFRRLLNSSLFLIKWIVLIIIAFFINFVVSKFVSIPQHADIFSLIEVLFAVIVTALSIVSSFAIATQWRELDSRLGKLDSQGKEFVSRLEMLDSQRTELDIQGKKLAEDIQAMKNFEQNAEKSFKQINASIAALTESSKQAIQSIDAIKEGAEKNTNELTSIAQQNKKDIESMKASLDKIVSAISQLGKQ